MKNRWKWLKAIFTFFKTPIGKKVKYIGQELAIILTDDKPNRPQLRELGKTHGREFAYFGLTAGEARIHEVIDERFNPNQATELKRKLNMLIGYLEPTPEDHQKT
jgi:hypothetical protein